MAAIPPYVAHTPGDDDPDNWQSMHDHTAGVTGLAVQFATPIGGQDVARCCGVLHDVGKYSTAFQQYLLDCHKAKQSGSLPPKPGSAEHKTAGAKLVLTDGTDPIRRLIAGCILGHHGGLPECGVGRIEGQLAAHQNPDQLTEAIANARHDNPTLIYLRAPAPEQIDALVKMTALPHFDAMLEVEMWTRMMFSCLVDADALDTEAHFSPDRRAERIMPGMQNQAGVWLEAVKRQVAMKQEHSPTGPVKQVREEVFQSCIAAGSFPPGLFTLTVPTGGGKTLSSLAFALAHAATHRRSRIIYAIPFTSIVEQTVKVFRDILGTEAVLEHHSAMEWRAQEAHEDKAKQQAEASWEQKAKLAAENWDAPLVVTTTVQLFESLFSNRTSRCRKLHNLANCVIVLDEVQTLPLNLLKPLVSGLAALLRVCDATIVLCTATQPAIAGESPLIQNLPKPTRIISEDSAARHFHDLTRVTYRVETDEWEWSRVAREMTEFGNSCMTVLNTKKDALALLDAVINVAPDRAYIRHLSTLLCGAHRRAVLDEVKDLLKAEQEQTGPPVILVTTQVIEAGCDIDFPRVLRARGPLDRMIQAAGRCNREGVRDRGDSEVILFNPKHGTEPPGEYRTAINVAWNRLTGPNGAPDLNAPDVSTAYFARLYQKVDLDKKQVQEARSHLDFPDVANKMKLIPDDTVPMLVPYFSPTQSTLPRNKVEFEKLVDNLRQDIKFFGGISRRRWSEVQALTVAVRMSDVEKHVNSTSAELLIPDQLYLWTARYDEVTGIGGMTGYASEDLVC